MQPCHGSHLPRPRSVEYAGEIPFERETSLRVIYAITFSFFFLKIDVTDQRYRCQTL